MKRRSAKSWLATLLIAMACCGADVRADEGATTEAERFAGDIVALARLLGEQHYEAPAKQQVVLLAARALYAGRQSAPPGDLAARCSNAMTDEEFAAILKDACGTEFVRTGAVRESVCEAISKSTPGGVQVLSQKAGAAQVQLSENRYVGVGIATKRSAAGELEIGTVMPGGPMHRAGIEENTIIRTIEGWATRDQPLEEVVERLRGPEGTSVTMTIRRPGRNEDEPLTLYRGVVPQKLLNVDIQDSSGRRIAVLRPREIGGSLAHEIQQFAAGEPNLDGVLLDLRGVSGKGHFAALVADQFLDGGEIGSRQRGSRKAPVRAEPGELLPEIPLAIATDQTTRGAAAWLATLLMERKRAVVFGQKGNLPNLDYQTFDLPSGDMAAFATTLLVTPGGATTLVVSEQTQAEPPAPTVVTAADPPPQPLVLTEPVNPLVRPGRNPQFLINQSAPMMNRGSFVIAKEYLENLPPKKG